MDEGEGLWMRGAMGEGGLWMRGAMDEGGYG